MRFVKLGFECPDPRAPAGDVQGLVTEGVFLGVPEPIDLTEADDRLVGEMVRRAAALAAEHGYAERGYRTVFNCNREAGQTVFHIHLHLLAGRSLSWPPG